MYEPLFNSILVEIIDPDGQWGGGNDESMLGKSFSKGQLLSYGERLSTAAYPLSETDSLRVYEMLKKLKNRNIMWNEGAEAGTTFEQDGKTFGFIYWWDLRGVTI